MAKRVKGHYYVSLYGGYCGIRKAKNIREARTEALREEGTNNVQYIRPATEEDLVWIKEMGGGIQ